jgi:hypothetical protein
VRSESGAWRADFCGPCHPRFTSRGILCNQSCLGGMAPWVLNVRDEKGVVHKVELVDGEATTVRQLKRHVNGVREPNEFGISDVSDVSILWAADVVAPVSGWPLAARTTWTRVGGTSSRGAGRRGTRWHRHIVTYHRYALTYVHACCAVPFICVTPTTASAL